jgi:hypothetical protein
VTASLTTAETSLDPTTHITAQELSDDGSFAVYAGGVAWNAAAINYVGTLYVYDVPAASKVATTLTGVSEVAPITGRSLYVNAPTAATPGVYKVTY